MHPRTVLRIRLFFVLAVLVTFPLQLASAQQKQVVWSANEQPLADQLHGLRSLADDVRAGTTEDLALKIRKLPATENKLRLAVGLAGLSTEGDFGHATLQEVATTLAETLRERPVPWAEPKDSEAGSKAAAREPAYPYIELASLVRYEHVEVPLNEVPLHMCRPMIIIIMTISFGRRWRGWRRMIGSGSIRSLRCKIFPARPGRLPSCGAKLCW